MVNLPRDCTKNEEGVPTLSLSIQKMLAFRQSCYIIHCSEDKQGLHYPSIELLWGLKQTAPVKSCKHIPFTSYSIQLHSYQTAQHSTIVKMWQSYRNSATLSQTILYIRSLDTYLSPHPLEKIKIKTMPNDQILVSGLTDHVMGLPAHPQSQYC